ncbi:MAG TPA: 2-dehydro-3-deoxygalactonokinase [Paracoccaceae bacterium]|mgnify:CR=1 FL=1|nr:2-dehydro-3-deoxygalactonokinase [Paracoccaceae bacterium]HMO72563.1 2-dehydro-3-deoxygalactonokinase [Paracoccaceae bacterium]
MQAEAAPGMVAAATVPDWIAVDWGTTRLRAWAMGPGGPLAETVSDEGMGALARGAFEGALMRAVGGWLPAKGRIPVVACGMVGSRQGWHEAPYRATPCRPLDPATLVAAPVADPRLRVRLVPGLRQDRPAEVMRGEETQIAGALALNPRFDGVLCLPGTHCKWAHVSAGEVVSFRTAMTGELFALIAGQSVLRHSMGGEGWDDAAFDAALSDAMTSPGGFAARLFGIRAEALLTGLAPGAARARLSGLLIGMELAAMRPWWLGQPVAVLGAPRLAGLYARALAAQGTAPSHVDATAATLAGLALARPTEE